MNTELNRILLANFQRVGLNLNDFRVGRDHRPVDRVDVEKTAAEPQYHVRLAQQAVGRGMSEMTHETACQRMIFGHGAAPHLGGDNGDRHRLRQCNQLLRPAPQRTPRPASIRVSAPVSEGMPPQSPPRLRAAACLRWQPNAHRRAATDRSIQHPLGAAGCLSENRYERHRACRTWPPGKRYASIGARPSPGPAVPATW